LTESLPEPSNGKDRRRVPRFPFDAAVEVIESASGKKIEARTTDLSLYGCYVRMSNPLPRGAQVFVKIFTDKDFFETTATVAYSQANVGIGLAFREVHPHYLPTLKQWLIEALQRMTNADEPL
jgi:hypothetical protein